MAIVYKITCNRTGKIYIGWSTLSLSVRWKRHLVCDKRCYIQHCIKKYGRQNFSIELLHDFDRNEDAVAKEIELINKWQTNISRYPAGNGMNMTDGGEGTIGYVATEEHKANLKRALKGKKKSAEHAESIRLAKLGDKNPMYKRPPTEKQRESARKRFIENNPHKRGELSHRFGKPSHMLGRKHSAETIEKLKSRPSKLKGIPRSEETKAKMSNAMKLKWQQDGHPGIGRKLSLESKEKMRNSRVAFYKKQKESGQVFKHSEETKQKMRDARYRTIIEKNNNNILVDN